jgi:hypothetical protein
MFTLQLGHPKINKAKPAVYTTMAEIFPVLFREQEESVYLFWKEIPVRINYRDDLRRNLDDILAMVWLLQKETTGKTRVHLSNQLLDMQLDLYWKADKLTIESTFLPQDDLYAPYAESLNALGKLELSRKGFLNEWKSLLHQLLEVFDAGKILIADGKERRKLELLQQTEQSIPDYGRLYTR